MNCMYCGAQVNREDQLCPQCGADVSVQKKALSLSVQYYNQGLDKAEIRDLSGAIDLLRRSLKYNKLNIQARNLLGLVYFETGEAVSALSEWIISKNIKPDNNIAVEYIQKLQAEPARLDIINQTIKKYNISLKCCREGNEDVAAVQLKKIVSQNPKLIKAYHLLALIYIKREEYERARKILKKAAKIDKTNSTTLRFLKEVDEQTGTVTSLEGRRRGLRRESEQNEKGREIYIPEGDVVVQPAAFRESSMFSGIVNIVLGIVVGVLVTWFLAVPSVRQDVNREADEKIVQYSNTMASQETQIANLQAQLDTATEQAESAQQQIEQSGKISDSYENLLQAYNAYQNSNYEEAAAALSGIDTASLSTEAKSVYDSIYEDVQGLMFEQLSNEGMDAMNSGDYETAIDLLTQAREINEEDYPVLSSLANAYRLSGDTENAIQVFEDIIEKFPDSRRADVAQNAIDQIRQGSE